MPYNNRRFEPPRTNMAFWLSAVYVCVIVYVTLHPIAAIRWTEARAWAFAFKPWTLQGVTSFDVGLNIMAYIPLGVVWTRMGQRSAWLASPFAAATCASVLALLLSFTLESIQSYSPARVASMLDVLCNTLGAVLGAGFVQFFHRSQLPMGRWLLHCIAPHRGAVWAVVGLWALAQLHPQGWAFMTAPLSTLTSAWLPASAPQGFGLALDTVQLRNLETVGAVVSLTGVLALIRLGLNRRLGLGAIALVMLLGLSGLLLWQLLAFWIQYGWGEWRLLASAGVLNAAWVLMGVALAWVVLPSQWVMVGAVMALALHTALAQMLPTHPYSMPAALWQQGRLVHAYGLTGAISALWPIMALAALVLQSRYKDS